MINSFSMIIVCAQFNEYQFPPQQSVQGVLRIFRALRGSTVPDALFDAYVDLLKEPNFTQDFLDIFAQDKRYECLLLHVRELTVSNFEY